MRAVVVEKQRGRSKSVKATRAYVCFLERKVYAFCGFAAQCRGPAFFVYGRAAEGDVGGGRWTGRGWIVGGTREELAGRATQKERRVRAVREKGRQMFFFFSRKDRRDICFVLQMEAEGGAQLSWPQDVGTAAENDVCADCGSAWKTQLVAACGRRSSLSSLYTLDTYAGAQSGRNGWMSVFSSLCIYSIS